MGKKQHFDNASKILAMAGKNANKYRVEGLEKALEIVKAGGVEALRNNVN